MILYSIVPVEVVFDSTNNCDEYNFMEIEYEGEKVVVTQLSNRKYKVDRLISTSPKAYLNPKLMPGQIIDTLV